MMSMSVNKVAMMMLGAVMAVGAVACQNPKVKRNRGRTVKANIAEFDPNADFEFDLGKYGSEIPDDYAIQLAFNQAFGGMDACVLNAKKDLGLGEAAQLEGDVEVAVMLDPKAGKPAGVNATLPNKYAKNTNLKDCIRNAVGSVTFPTYDGTPRQANFSCELDAGSEYEEEW